MPFILYISVDTFMSLLIFSSENSSLPQIQFCLQNLSSFDYLQYIHNGLLVFLCYFVSVPPVSVSCLFLPLQTMLSCLFAISINWLDFRYCEVSFVEFWLFWHFYKCIWTLVMLWRYSEIIISTLSKCCFLTVARWDHIFYWRLIFPYHGWQTVLGIPFNNFITFFQFVVRIGYPLLCEHRELLPVFWVILYLALSGCFMPTCWCLTTLLMLKGAYAVSRVLSLYIPSHLMLFIEKSSVPISSPNSHLSLT